MNIEHVRDRLETAPGLPSALGMRFLSTPDQDECVAVMPTDHRTIQPFGFLSGGAIVALAETLAGAASLARCPDRIPLGISVSANHLRPVPQGESVRAVARFIHCGHTHHSFLVSVFNGRDELVSSVQVVNGIVSPREK